MHERQPPTRTEQERKAGPEERFDDEPGIREDGTLPFEGPLDVSADDDFGTDPYNRTGRFKRNIR